MKAIIMAGGQGIRLKPLTSFIPKPLIPICGTPVMEILIKQLVSQGFSDITVCLYHFANLIQSYFGDGSRWDVQIDYVIEPEPMGTIGGLLIVENLPDKFLVVNGDILTNFDFKMFFENHSPGKISAAAKEERCNYGVFLSLAENSCIFLEKPFFGYNMGAYVIEINHVGRHEITKLLSDTLNVDLHFHKGAWFDIGTPGDLEAAEKWYEKRSEK